MLAERPFASILCEFLRREIHRSVFVSSFVYLRDARSIQKKKKKKYTIDKEYLQFSKLAPREIFPRYHFFLFFSISCLFFPPFFLCLFLVFASFSLDILENIETHPSFDDASPKCKIDRATGSCRHCRVTECRHPGASCF